MFYLAHWSSHGRCVVHASEQSGELALEGELGAVAEAAGARLRAETDEDAAAAQAAADALTHAATTAMAAGYSLTEIARAEARGKDTLRDTLRTDALKLVERTGARAREAQAEHYRAIARASRLGLPMREIANAAHVTHGTIRAITQRLASREADSAAVADQASHPAADQPSDTAANQPWDPAADQSSDTAADQPSDTADNQPWDSGDNQPPDSVPGQGFGHAG